MSAPESDGEEEEKQLGRSLKDAYEFEEPVELVDLTTERINAINGLEVVASVLTVCSAMLSSIRAV